MEDGCDSNRISLKSKNRINELVFNTENAIFYGKSTQFEPVDDCYYFRLKKIWEMNRSTSIRMIQQIFQGNLHTFG